MGIVKLIAGILVMVVLVIGTLYGMFKPLSKKGEVRKEDESIGTRMIVTIINVLVCLIVMSWLGWINF